MRLTQEQAKALLERINTPFYLYPDFTETMFDLIRAIRQQRLPFAVYETYRTPQRQRKLISLGFSKLKNVYQSKHVHGLAVDFLIESKVVTSPSKNKIIEMVSKGNINDNPEIAKSNLIYNTGVNILGTESKKPRTIVEDGQVLEWWKTLGLLIERQFPDLVWGGDKNISDGQLIGSDPMHVESRHADKLMRGGHTIKALRANGNPGLH